MVTRWLAIDGVTIAVSSTDCLTQLTPCRWSVPQPHVRRSHNSDVPDVALTFPHGPITRYFSGPGFAGMGAPRPQLNRAPSGGGLVGSI